MSVSAEAPSASAGSPPQVDKKSPPADTASPPSDSAPTPPKGSPPEASPSPPSDSNSNSSPPKSSLPSPPSVSDTPPQPPASASSPPNPPDGSNSPQPSPPSDSGSSSTLPPPEGPSSLNSPPNTSVSPPPPPPPSSTPPTKETPIHSPPPESLPPPVASNGSPSPPDAGNSEPSPHVKKDSPPKTPNVDDLFPQFPDSPPAPTGRNPTPSIDFIPSSPTVSTPPASRTSHPKITPPSKESDYDFSISGKSSPSSKSSGSSGGGSAAGAIVAGVVIIAFVAFIFVVMRRRKKRKQGFTTHYRPQPDSFSVRTDGYYYGQQQQHTIGVTGHSQEYYGGMPPPPAMVNSYGSYRGNVLNSGPPESSTLAGSKSCFSYEDMMEITNGFSQQNVIGEGGFGSVYKGWLPEGKVVAVKQLKAGSGQGEREFRAEVEIISRVHHRHLVSLVGYCIAEHHRLLVYEFVPNGTLEHHLHGKGVPVMEWSKRVKIAIGAARGLAYLHDDCHPKIIHRDIKSANILVEDDFEAQVADFGLAKLSNDTHTHVSTRVMGTFGYLAPEYASSGKLTDRSDVFSFGVVLLELVTGRKPVDPTQPLGDESLVEWARPLLIRAIETGDLTDLVDSRLEKRFVESELFRMIEAAAACVRHSAPKRPRMVQVLRALDTEGDMPDLSNGVKFGQSTIFGPGQSNADMQKFRMMAFGSDDSSEYDIYSGEHKPRPPSSWKPGYSGSLEFPSGESETRAMNPRGGELNSDNYSSHRFSQK